MTKLILLLIGLTFVCHAVIAQVNISEFRKLKKETTTRTVTLPGLSSLQGILSIPSVESISFLRTESKVKSTDSLISTEANRQLIKRDIQFTVLGSQSPTPGFSLDLSEKLAIKVTGLIPSKRKIITLDVTAASNSDQDNIPIFSEGKFNGQISAGLNFHIIPIGKKEICKNIILGNTYPFENGAREFLSALKTVEDAKYELPVLDTIAVLAAYLRLHPSGKLFLNRAVEVKTSAPEGETITCGDGAINIAFPGILGANPAAIQAAMPSGSNQEYLFLKLADTYFPLKKSYSGAGATAALITDLPTFTFWKADKLYADLVQLSKAFINSQQAKIDDEIRRSQPFWLRKQLNWFTVSIKPVFRTLNTFTDNTAIKRIEVNSTNFFEFEIPLWYQFYDVRAKGGNLWRIGVQPTLGTNQNEYTEGKYVKTDTLSRYPGAYVIDQSEKTGIFTTGESREARLYLNYYLEFYRLPRRNFVPGTSVKLAYAKNAVFGKDTERRLRLEVGAVLNILNSDKAKSAFTLQPYAAITNLKKEMTLVNGVERPKTFAEKFYIGIRVGLPIRGQLGVGQ